MGLIQTIDANAYVVNPANAPPTLEPPRLATVHASSRLRPSSVQFAMLAQHGLRVAEVTVHRAGTVGIVSKRTKTRRATSGKPV